MKPKPRTRLLPVLALPLALGLGAGAAAAEDTGEIRGRVVYEGAPPTPKKLEPTSDTDFCRKQVLVDESLVVDPKTRGLRSVAVWVEGTKAPDASEKPVIDNYLCRYATHVVIAHVKRPVLIKNNDPFLHTTQAKTKSGKTIFNIAFPVKGQTTTKKFKRRGFYSLHCDVHTWMLGWAVVLDGEIATTTHAQGEFTLRGVPPGKHTVHLWHETLGERTVPVEVKAGGFASVDLSWKPTAPPKD